MPIVYEYFININLLITNKKRGHHFETASWGVSYLFSIIFPVNTSSLVVILYI
jgi:hypothetical protein